MYIKDIILDGFKCYEEKTTIKNLDKFYNAITGLNGSGKSNIVDAIIFVLGLESRKLLRTNSLKELINVKRKDCKVTIVLNNSDKNKSPEGYVDYNEIIISRSYDFMGKSKFMLNNHSCSMNTIHKLCSNMGINSEKGEFFFIIMQGHITKILNMKSKEIGNLIEETSGTRSFIKEKEKAITALEKKELKLIEVKDTIIKHISPFYNRLRSERELFNKYKTNKENLKILSKEHQKLKKIIFEDELSKNILSLKNYLENYIKDKNLLDEVEQRMNDLECIESDENNINIKEMLDDEKIKYDELKNNNLNDKLNCIKIISLPEKKYDVKILKEKENLLIKKLKSLNTGLNNNIDVFEELNILKQKKVELEFRLKKFTSFNIDEIEKKIVNISKYKINLDEHEEDKRKYFSLKSKINYTPGHNIFGTIDENINLKNEKYREAIFTILGNKAKYIIVNDEQTGSKLLKDSEKRVSVIPLSKINAKYIKNDLIRKVKNEGGIHAIDLVEFDSKYKKAMEHVFNGYFIFEYSDAAQKICYEYKIICVTLDGSIYDPKGTLTGGKLNYKIDIIKRSDIEILEKKIKNDEYKNAQYKKYSDELLTLKKQQKEYSQKIELEEEFNLLNIKIDTISKFDNLDIRKELEFIRKNIIEAIKEENEHSHIKTQNKKNEEKIKSIKEQILKNEQSLEEIRKKIINLQNKLGEDEIKISNKRLSTRQIEGFEPKQQYLIKNISKLKIRIIKLYNEINKQLTSDESVNLTFTNSNDFSNSFIDVSDQFKIDRNIFCISNKEIDEQNHKDIITQLSELESNIAICKETKAIRMESSNFNLLEKNELMIKNIQEKIQLLELDKQKILNSIANFDLLGIKENDRAFKHLNLEIGKFLRYFFKDSDVKIIKNNKSNLFEMKVKIGNWKESLNELSGGQRSLIALCMIFSILTYKPTPFYIFDEIDSALDLNYTQNIGEILKKEFNNSQFIVISLKNGLYENANNVYKVFIKDGKSNICQIK